MNLSVTKYLIYYKHLFLSHVYENNPPFAINFNISLIANYNLRLVETLLKRKGVLKHFLYIIDIIKIIFVLGPIFFMHEFFSLELHHYIRQR